MSAGYKKKQAAKVQLIPGTCGFCGLDKDDEEVYGKLLHRDNASVHYFCMLFASGLCQNGDSETQGVMGFLIQDIIKEIRRAARLRCVFCKKTGATIGCVVSRCRVVFHLPCGLENGVLNQFTGKFCSYCEEHRPRQSTPCSDRLAFHGTAKSVCSICMASVEARSSNSTIRTPCCKNSWFHKQCLQRHATCSGLHFFRCPLCNNKEIFQDEMLRYGIYIPDQDAAWEQEPDAFNELLERYSRCDTKTCKCPHGRDYSKNDCKWEIMLCDWCGSQGTHLSCGHLKTPMDDWVCAQCTEITGQTATKAKTPKSKNAGKEKTKRTKKEPVDRDWLEKKLAAMKTPTVPTGRGVKRKRDSTTPDDKTRKKRPYKRRNTTPAATATQSAIAASPEACQSRDASSSCLGRRTRDWTAEEMLLGYQLRVPVTRMTAGMIRKARRRIKRQAAPKENPPQQASSSVSTLEDNNEKLSYADFVEKHFSSGDARFTSYCDRIMRYQEYLYGPAPLTASGIQIESVWSISDTTSVDETIASSCDEGDMDDQSMTGFLRGLQALNRKFTSINSRKPSTVTSGSKETLSEPSTLQSPTSSQTVTSSRQNYRLTNGKNPSAVSTSTSTENASSSSKKSDSSCSENIHSDKSNLITSYFKKPECPPVSTETDLPSKQTPSKPCDVAPSVPPEEAVITLASDDEDQSGTPDAPIVLEGRPDEEEDLFIVSAVVAPKKCTCGKWKQRQKEKNNCAQELHTQTQDTLNKTQDKQNKTQETPKTIAPKDKFASSIDASLDILTIASDSDSQGDIIKLNPGPDKIPTSPLSDSENQQPISDRTRPQAAPNQPINDRTRPQPAPSKPYPKPPLLTPSPELFKPSFQPGKFYKNSPSHQPKYNHSTLQAKYNGQSLQPKYPGPQPVRPASPLATVYSNTTVYKDTTQENAYHIQQVQQVNLAPQLQPLGPYAANSCGLNPYPVSSQMLYTYPPTRDCDDITAMSVAYKNQPHAATKCGKCCTCKKK